MRKLLLLLTFCLSGWYSVQAQQRLSAFSREPEKFIAELSDLFDEQKKGTGKELIEKQFAPIWLQQPAYTPQQQEMIFETLDLLLKNKSKVFPDFDYYIRSLIAFPKARKTDADFLQWQQMVLKILADKKFRKYTTEILESSVGLFADLTFFQSDAVKWVSSSPGFWFEFDSVPRVVFPSLNLKCYSKGDSSVIYSTSGAFYPTTGRFIGAKGRITWQRAGFDPALTYAEFDEYDIRVRGSTYVIDSVTFYNEFFNRPLLGQLTEKILANKTEEDATYPRFESYFRRLQIQNIVPNVDFDGGFTMAGTKLAGSGTIDEPALLTFYRDSKKFLVARSLAFDIKPDRIVSGHASATFYVEKDSIIHPDLNLSFDRKTRQLILLRTDEGVSKAPFQNTYHNVDMYFDALYWNLDDPLIKMGAFTGSTQRIGAFESNEYFKKKRYDTMSGISMTHPLYEIKKYADYAQIKSFYAKELAIYTRSSEEQWHAVLIDLNNKGFISYDINARFITIRPKLYAYIENNIGKRDYDVIQFNSEVPTGHNAQLSLLNYDLLVKGIENFALSDSQRVTIYPQNGEVIIRKNRDFTFGGRVFAGNFEFMGTEYAFSYKDFRLDLIKVDSCRIYVEDESLGKDNMGNYQKRRIRSVLRDLAGNIRIDSPTNKGGYHSYAYPQYPIFNCTKTSYVFWEDPNIQKGVYKRDSFYYQVKPFTIDSLDNFTKKDLKFNGTLVSGIFPDIEEPLVLMEDYSLGFKRNTGAGGLPAYAGKAKVTADLKLDYSGFKGAGELDYLTAHATSDEFTFLPESAHGQTKSFINREQTGKVEIPKATCDTTLLAFYPKQDKLDVSSIDKPISFFEKEATLAGTLHLQPQGMTGEGVMEFSDARLSSDGFTYTRRKILAPKSDFQLAGMGDEAGLGLAFKTDNVNSDVDFDKRQGLFKSNSGETKIEFPVNQYICFMDQFTWYMDRAELDLSSSRKPADDLVIDTGEDIKRSNFFSIAAGQDSLNFLSPRAKYDLKKSRIYCQKINHILVADSKISPDSGKVIIEKYADMQKLQRARILSNYVTQHHKMFNCELKIEGRRKYNGSGDIAYVDENKREQVIHFNEIRVDTSFQTVGNGIIKPEDQFFLSPAFEYHGKFAMAANNPFLTFDGGARILHNCAAIERTYYKFKAEINPLEIFIPVDSSLRDMEMAKLGLGVMVSQTSPMDVYSSFFSRRRDKDDQSLIESNGFLYFDKQARKYMVGSKEKIRQPKLPGNLLALGAENCELTGDGRMDFNVNYGLVKLTHVAELKYITDKNQLTAQSVSLIQFPFDEGCMKRMYEQIEQFPNLTPVDVTKTKFEKSLVELLGTERSDKLISELNLAGQLKRVPEELISTFYFADLKWQWDPVNEVFHTVGPLGIASMEKKQLFRYVKGKIEIEKRRSADMIRIYIELDAGNWYFFEYKLGIMNVISSDKEFQTILTDVKDDKRKFEENNVKYTYQLVASRKKRDDLLSRYPDLQ